MSLLSSAALALRYDPQEVLYNINTNETATDPLDYWGQWENHSFHPSPSNWRMPMYTLMLDRLANGDPTNDDANGTQYEHDLGQTQLRHGGDITGLKDSLDYLQGMGIKVSGPGGMLTASRTSANIRVIVLVHCRQPTHQSAMVVRWIQSSRFDSPRPSFRYHSAVARCYYRDSFPGHVRGHGQYHVYVSHLYGISLPLIRIYF